MGRNALYRAQFWVIAPSVTRKCSEMTLRLSWLTIPLIRALLLIFNPYDFHALSLSRRSLSRSAEIGCEAKWGGHVMCRGRGLWSIGSKPPLPARPIPTPFRHTITHTYTSCLPTLSRQVHNAIYINIRRAAGGDIGVTATARKRNSCLSARTRKTIRLSILSTRRDYFSSFFPSWERAYRVFPRRPSKYGFFVWILKICNLFSDIVAGKKINFFFTRTQR